MFEKFSYSRKKSPFNNDTKTSESKDCNSRQDRLKKARTLGLDEVVVAVTETPVGSPEVDSNDSHSTDDEDLLKPALGTDTEGNKEAKGYKSTRTDSKAAMNKQCSSKNVQKSYKESVHDGKLIVKTDKDIIL